MTDRALANAEKRRDELAARINQTNQRLVDLRKDLAATEAFIADWHRYADTDPDRAAHTQADSSYPQGVHRDVKSPAGTGLARGVVPIGGGVAGQGVAGGGTVTGDAGFYLDPTPDPAPPTRKNPDRLTVGAHVKQIINELKRPVLREDLFNALAERGIVIHGKDPQMVLSTMMWRMPQDFIRLAGHGYWLRALPWAPANYEGGRPFALATEAEQDVLEAEIFDPESVSDA